MLTACCSSSRGLYWELAPGSLGICLGWKLRSEGFPLPGAHLCCMYVWGSLGGNMHYGFGSALGLEGMQHRRVPGALGW